jgi:prolyl-tRNA synthetase
MLSLPVIELLPDSTHLCRAGHRGERLPCPVADPRASAHSISAPDQLKASCVLSRYLLPVTKETPADAQIVSHKLMLRAGLVRQTAAGIYAWLPLGLRVLKKIEQVVREEQDKAGAIELLMPTIQSADLWRQSGRYDAYGPEMLRIIDRHQREMLYGPTNEEMITVLFRDAVKSYRDLPRTLYHISGSSAMRSAPASA